MKICWFLCCLTILVIRGSNGRQLLTYEGWRLPEHQSFNRPHAQYEKRNEVPKESKFPPTAEETDKKMLQSMVINKIERQKRQVATTWEGKQQLDLNQGKPARGNQQAQLTFKTKRMSDLYNRWLTQKEELVKSNEKLMNSENKVNRENRVNKDHFITTTVQPKYQTVRRQFLPKHLDRSKNEDPVDITDPHKKTEDGLDVKPPTIEDQNFKEIQFQVEEFRRKISKLGNHRPMRYRNNEGNFMIRYGADSHTKSFNNDDAGHVMNKGGENQRKHQSFMQDIDRLHRLRSFDDLYYKQPIGIDFKPPSISTSNSRSGIVRRTGGLSGRFKG